MRTNYQGTVRDSEAETARDARMLALHERGLTVSIIAQRMGVTVNSARKRIYRARAAREDGQSLEKPGRSL